MNRGLGAGLIASAAMIAVITAASRMIGFGRWIAFSNNVGATCIGDAYASANLLPNVLFEVAAGGALAGAVVPLLAGPISRAAGGVAGSAGSGRVDGGRVDGAAGDVDRIASALLSWALLVLVPVSVLLAVLAGPLSRLLIDETCPGQRALTARLILVFAPQIVLYGIGVVLSGVLTAHRRFLWPAAAPLLSSLVVIGAYAAFGATAHGARQAARLPGTAQAWLGWGTTAGVVVMTIPLLFPLHRVGVRLRPSLHFPPGVGRRGLALAGAGIGALLAQQASLLVTLKLANRSGISGAFPVFQYAQAVYLLPYAVLAVPLATSAFPRLAERASAGDNAGYAATASLSTRAVVVASLFGAAVLAGVALPVGHVFAVIDASKAVSAGSAPSGSVSGALPSLATALTVMAPGLLGFGLIAHLSRALYALEHGRAAATATATGWLAVIVSSVLAVRTAPVVVGLAWGNTLGMTVAGGLLLLALGRSAGPHALAGLPRVLLAGGAAAVIGGWAGREVAVRALHALGIGLTGALVSGVLAALAAGGVFAVLLAALDRKDLTTVASWARPQREGVR